MTQAAEGELSTGGGAWMGASGIGADLLCITGRLLVGRWRFGRACSKAQSRRHKVAIQAINNHMLALIRRQTCPW